MFDLNEQQQQALDQVLSIAEKISSGTMVIDYIRVLLPDVDKQRQRYINEFKDDRDYSLYADGRAYDYEQLFELAKRFFKAPTTANRYAMFKLLSDFGNELMAAVDANELRVEDFEELNSNNNNNNSDSDSDSDSDDADADDDQLEWIAGNITDQEYFAKRDLTVNDKFYFHIAMFGKWQQLSNNCTITFDEYDKLTPADLVYSNSTSSSAVQAARSRYRKMMTAAGGGPGMIGIHEHYDASQGYFHVMFDVDEVHTEQDYLGVIEYFKPWCEHIGHASVAHYTNNEQLAQKYNIPYIADAKKFYSAHIVFYETCIPLYLLCELFAMDPSDNNKFLNDGLKYQDTAIWKEVMNCSGRLMRTAISNKLERRGQGTWTIKHTAVEHVVDLMDHSKQLPLSTNLITVKGTERVLRRADILMCGVKFNIVPTRLNASVTLHGVRSNISKDFIKNNVERTDVENIDGLVTITYEQLAELLDTVEEQDTHNRTYNMLLEIAPIICHNKHVFQDLDEINKVLENWYNKIGQAHIHDHDYPEEFVTKCFTDDDDDAPTNSWLYALGSRSTLGQTHWLKRFAYDKITINDITVGQDYTTTFDRVTMSQYEFKYNINKKNKTATLELTGFKRLLNDLKQCVGVHLGVVYLLTSDKGFVPASLDAIQHLYPHKPFGNVCPITIASIIHTYTSMLTYSEIVFCTVEEAKQITVEKRKTNPVYRCLNLFHGYNATMISTDLPKYAEGKALVKMLVSLLTDDYYPDYETRKEAMKDDTNKLSAEHREYKQLLGDLCYIFSHVDKLNKVHNFRSMEGVGKGTLIKLLSAFAGHYISANVTSIDSIIGNRNAHIIDGKLLVDTNELRGLNSRSNNDAMNTFKAYVDGDPVPCEDKWVVGYSAVNRCSFFTASNESFTNKTTSDARRMQFHLCSPVLKVVMVTADPTVDKQEYEHQIAMQKQQQAVWNAINAQIKDRDVVNGAYTFIMNYLTKNEARAANYERSNIIYNDFLRNNTMRSYTEQERYINNNPDVYNRLVEGFKTKNELKQYVIGTMLNRESVDIKTKLTKGCKMNEDSRLVAGWLQELYKLCPRTSVRDGKKVLHMYKLHTIYVRTLDPSATDIQTGSIASE